MILEPTSQKIIIFDATQSSVHGHNKASKAIDGKLTGFGEKGGCAETSSKHDKQWWMGEISENHVVTSIRIMPRYDCCRERYSHVTVDTSLDGNTWTLCAHLGGSLKTAAGNSWVDAKCPESTMAKYVKIILHDKNLFALCEVEAFGYKPGTIRSGNHWG